MKLRYILLTALFLFTITVSNAQTYVNKTATGSNDGTSWANAYTELHDALENYNSGDEIWVAAGTYLPQIPSTWPGTAKNTFYIHQDLTLYGGFNGTETTLADRDPEANITILSGDLNGDDVDTDFEMNRSDNAINVVHIESTVSTESIIDGFTIKSGHADEDDDSFDYNQGGGGIYSEGSPQIKNCIFHENYAELFGGGLMLLNETSTEAMVVDCIFEGNKSGFRAGGMIAALTLPGDVIQVNNCQFIGNLATEAGGALYTWRASTSISNCQFSENNSEFLGGAIYIYSNNNDIGFETIIEDSDFENNVSPNGGGVAFTSTGDNYNLSFSSCNFVNNGAGYGGAIFVHYFDGNPQNNTISVADCLIQGNSAQEIGGGLVVIGTFGTNNLFEMNNCEIFENNAGNSGGFAIAHGGTNNSVLINSTHFKANEGSYAGSVGVNINSAVFEDVSGQRTEFTNCLFTEHLSSIEGSQVVRAGGLEDIEMSLINCTFTDNDISNIGVESEAKINLQNTILNHTNAPNFSFGDSMTGAVNSLGGNLISDNSVDTWLGSTDQSNVDPLFVGSGDYQLTENSPAVDKGILFDEVPEFDLAGNDRVNGCLDIGAYESPFLISMECITSDKEILVDDDNLSIFPNPVQGEMTLQLQNDWSGELTLQIINSLGQVVYSDNPEKTADVATWQINTANLGNGIYRILLSNDSHMIVETMTKI